MQVVEEAYQMVPKLVILVEVCIWRLTVRVHETKEEMDKVQLELNLQIAEL